MKKLKKSAKIILISAVSAICVLAIVLGTIFATRGKHPNNPESSENQDLFKNPSISYASSNNLNLFTVSPYQNVCDPDDVVLLGSNYFIYQDKNENKHLAVFKENNGTFDVKVLTSEKYGFVKEGAESFRVVSYNENYAVIKSVFESTNETYDNETYSVVYFGGETPVEVYSISSNGEFDIFTGSNYLSESFVLFEKLTINESETKYYDIDLFCLMLNKSEKINDENKTYILKNKIVYDNDDENVKYNVDCVDKDFITYIANLEIGLVFMHNGELKTYKTEIENLDNYNFYKLKEDKFLLEIQKQDTSIEYFTISFKDGILTSEKYLLNENYQKIASAKTSETYYYIVSQKYTNSSYEQKYLYQYFNLKDELIAEYESTFGNDEILQLNDDVFVTYNGIYKKSNENKFLIFKNFSDENLRFSTCNAGTLVVLDDETGFLRMFNLNNECEELKLQDETEILQVSKIQNDKIFVRLSNDEYYVFNLKNNENMKVENFVKDDLSDILFENGFYVCSNENSFTLSHFGEKLVDFDTYEVGQSFSYGYAISYYKNNELVKILSAEDGYFNVRTTEYYNDGTGNVVEAYNIVETYDDYTHGSESNALILVYSYDISGAFKHKESISVYMDKGYKALSTGSSLVIKFYNKKTITIKDSQTSCSIDYSSVDCSSSDSYSSVGWSSSERKYYIYLYKTYYSGDASFSSFSGSEKITYSITLDRNSGSGGTSSTTVKWNNKISSITKPTKTGYQFAGYYDSSSGGTQYINSSGSGIKTWDKSGSFSYTLYAHWTANTYYVKYNQNKPSGASNSVTGSMSNSTHTYDTSKNLTSNAYTLTGWTFKGWSTSSTSSTVTYSNGASVKNLTSTNGGTYNLYAVWSANTYTITLAGNSGTLTSRSASSGLTLSGTTFTATYDTTGVFTVKVKRTGYQFSSWTKSTSSGSVVNSFTNNADTTAYVTITSTVKNLTSTSGGSVTLTANWTAITYYIGISGNGGTVSSKSAGTNASYISSSGLFKLTYDKVATFYNYIYRTGYIFSGWTVTGTDAQFSSSSPNYTTVDATTTAIKITSSIKNATTRSGVTIALTAKWTPINYFIEYDGNDPAQASSSVQGTVATTTMTYDSTTVKLATNSFTLTGWTFLGWSQNSSATTATYSSGGTPSKLNATTVRNGTITMYAIWQANTYYIKFAGNGGTVNNLAVSSGVSLYNTSTFSATYDYTGVFTVSAVKTGYKFAGWSISTGKGSANAVPNSAYSTFDDYYNANTNSSSSISVKTTILNLTPTSGATVTLTAQWTSISYYVKLASGNSNAYISNLSSGTNSTLSGSRFKVSYGITCYVNNDIKRDGYTFNAWTNSGAGTVTSTYTIIDDTTTAISISTGVLNLTHIHNKEITLTAKWTAITYYIYLNGSSGTVSNHGNVSNLPFNSSTTKFTATYDTEGTLKANIVRAGYKFTNFKNTSSKGTVSTVPYNTSYSAFSNYYISNPNTSNSVQVKTTALNLTTTRNATINLTAEWSAISYTLTYNSNKPSASTYSPTGSTSNSYATYDQKVTFSTSGFSIIGWTQLGWSNVSTDTSAKFANGGTASYNFTTVDNSTVTIYAIWRKNNYTINYILNGGTKNSSKTYTVNAQFDTAFLVSLPERIGYTFSKYTISGMSTNNKKYVGQSNPPTTALSESTTTYTMTKQAYYKNLTSVDGGTVNFEASWTPNQYSITYNYSNGKADTSGLYPTRATYDVSFSVSAPIRLGYTFTGWNISGMDTVCTHYYGSSTTTSATISKTLATTFKNLRATDGTVTMTATWSANVYKISYDYAGGGEKSGLSYPKTLTYDTWSTISNPVRTGYTFTNWIISGMSDTCTHYYGKSSSDYTSTTNQNLTISDITMTAFMNLHSETNATVSFKAVWKANTYKIVYKYDQNGLTGAEGAKNNPSSATYDKSFQVYEPLAYPFGYHFNGWVVTQMSTTCNHYYGSTSSASSSMGSVSSYTVGASSNFFKNLHSEEGSTVILTANWAPNTYNLKYILTDVKGGDGRFTSSAPTTANYDAQFTIPTVARTGYTFVGWSFSGLADYGEDDTSTKLLHYYSKNNTPFVSTNGSYAKDETDTNAAINSDTFKNLHYKQGATVTLTANWKANNYTITYHYLSDSFNSELLNNSNINTYIYTSSWKTKAQTVTYDSTFSTMKMSKSDTDKNGVVTPDNVKILYWIFYSSPVSENYRFANLDGNSNPVPVTKYYLGVGQEYVYSSYELFGEYALFGSNVHAYAIYGFTDITLKFYGASSKVGYNNLSSYSLKSTSGTTILGSVSLGTSLGGHKIIGYMISSNYMDFGELNSNSITTYTTKSGLTYTARAGTQILWGYSSSQAYDSENPTFYLYAVYDTSIKNMYSPTTIDSSGYKVIGLNTTGMFESGKTYSITISGFESSSYYDITSIKLSKVWGSSSIVTTDCAFDGVKAHTGAYDIANVSNFKVSVPNTSTVTITFTANSYCTNFNLFLFYNSSVAISTDFVDNLRLVIQEVK